MTLSPQDVLALQIGRHMLDLAIAQQRIATLEQQNAELLARLTEYESQEVKTRGDLVHPNS